MEEETKVREVELKLDGIILEKLPDYGDLITLADFIEYCRNRSFIDYDGTGAYATKEGKSNIYVSPSEIVAGKIDERFSHVMWFNR